MWLRIRPRSLSGRIAIRVAFGLTIILLLVGVIAVWTIQDSTEAEYRARVALAEALAKNADDVLRYASLTLEREATGLTLRPGQPPLQDQLRRLSDLRLRIGSLAALSVLDVDGAVLWTDSELSDVPASPALGIPDAQSIFAVGDVRIAQVTSSAHAERVFASLAVPLPTADGHTAGVLIAVLDPSRRALASLPSGEGSDSMDIGLVNTDGVLLDGRRPTDPGAKVEHQALLADLMATHTAGYRLHDPMSLTGLPSHIVAYAPLSLLPSWGIVLEQPKDVVSVPEQLERRLGLLGLVLLFLTASIAWLEARRVVRPLQQLTSSAERFAAGQFDRPVAPIHTEELGLLAHAFETMRQRLRASLAQAAEWNRELERRVATRTVEIELRNRELAQLNEIAELVSASLELEPLLRHTLVRILEITSVEVGCLWMTEDDGTRLTLIAERGLPQAAQAGESCRQHQQCVCSRAANTGESVVGDEVAFGDACESHLGCGLLWGLAVPLPAAGRVQGVLFLGSHRPQSVRKRELARLSAIGRQVGMALANARLYQNLRVRERERAGLLERLMAAQEEERQRLARELHDEAGQALVSLQFGLERLASVADDPEYSRQLAQQLRGITVQTLAAIHKLALELRPSVLDDIGLVPAVERYLQECTRRWNLAVDFAAVKLDDVRLAATMETPIYRILQSALTNVARHAKAQNVSVLLERRGESLVLVVEDDGQGFDLTAVRAAPLEARLGLVGMEERASLIGATLTVETAPGAGTAVFLEVPLSTTGLAEESHVEAANLARR